MKLLFNYLFFCCFILLLISCNDDKDEDPKPDATAVSITGIQVITMPLVDANGSRWDVIDDADVFFKIETLTSVFYDHPNATYEVVNASLPLGYSITNGYKLPSMNQTYYISLYDYDVLGSEFIGAVSFNPNNNKSSRPSSLTISSTTIKVTVNLKWE